MQLLPLADIIIREDRIRKTFNEEGIEALSESISSFGLLHAIVVEKDGKTLVAGENRIKAIMKLRETNIPYDYGGEKISPDLIPAVNLGELSRTEYKEAELDENIKRINLHWREKAAAVAELHNLREAQKGYQSKFETAKELVEASGETRNSMSNLITDVSNDLIVAAYGDDPDVQKAKSRGEAIKIIEKKLDKLHKEALSKEFEVSEHKTPHNLIQGDLFNELPNIDGGTFAVIIADPPYGVDADKFSNQSADKHTYSDSPEYSTEVVTAIAREGYRIAEKKAHFYMFCDINRFSLIKRLVEVEGWKVWNTPLIWYRGSNSGIAPVPDYGPRRTYECILFANKGKRKVNAINADCIVDFRHEAEYNRAASKPSGLYRHLLQWSVKPGDLVLDPCCGTGPIFTAAEATQCIAWGIERDRHASGISANRIRDMEKEDA